MIDESQRGTPSDRLGQRESSSDGGVQRSHSWKSCEIAVRSTNRGSMFDCQSSQRSIGHERAGDLSGVDEIVEDLPESVSRLEKHDGGMSDPTGHDCRGFGSTERMGEKARVSPDS